MVPAIQQPGKDETVETVKIAVVSRGGSDKQAERRGIQGGTSAYILL